MTTREELIDKVARLVLSWQHGDRDYEPNPWQMEPFRALAEAGLLADPEQAAELAEWRECAEQGLGNGWPLLRVRKALGTPDGRAVSIHAAEVVAERNELEGRVDAGLKLIDDQMALFGSVMAESQAGILRDIRAVLTGEVTLDD